MLLQSRDETMQSQPSNLTKYFEPLENPFGVRSESLQIALIESFFFIHPLSPPIEKCTGWSHWLNSFIKSVYALNRRILSETW